MRDPFGVYSVAKGLKPANMAAIERVAYSDIGRKGQYAAAKLERRGLGRNASEMKRGALKQEQNSALRPTRTRAQAERQGRLKLLLKGKK